MMNKFDYVLAHLLASSISIFIQLEVIICQYGASQAISAVWLLHVLNYYLLTYKMFLSSLE